MTPVVLVLRALGLGDLLTAVPALRAVRAHWPGHRIVLAAPEGLTWPARATGAVDEVAGVPDLAAFRWSGPAPDVAVNLHGSGPQSIAALRGTGARRVLSHAHPDHPEVPGPDWSADEHEVRRWCRLLAHHGVPADPADLGLPPPGPTPLPGAAVLHPGASHAARRWPAERFARVAAALAYRGERVVLTGDRRERAAVLAVVPAGGLGDEAVLAGRTGLPELAALVAAARLVVCGDTGVSHLATAYGTPSVTLFGPVAPAQWGPPEDPRHVALWAGRRGDTFADRPDPGLLALHPEDVLDAAGPLLRAEVPR
ncbi:glycosyltransferase family 9 protein [Saccharopolyspora cebuensis]|uniref:glycosyltransferase family 9 protein n=1 Tax=Saccharopolyspora cebuensis TaxID=418759 RepID=UPI003CD070C0